MSMEELEKAIRMAFEAYEKKYGADAKFDEGDEFVTVLNNCSLVISLKNGKLETRFIGGKPLQIDLTLKIYEREEAEGGKVNEPRNIDRAAHP